MTRSLLAVAMLVFVGCGPKSSGAPAPKEASSEGSASGADSGDGLPQCHADAEALRKVGACATAPEDIRGGAQEQADETDKMIQEHLSDSAADKQKLDGQCAINLAKVVATGKQDGCAM